MELEHLTEQNFEKKIKEGKVLVDCYADWCSPCRMLAPIIEEVAKEISDYTVYKMNVDEAPDISAKLGIMSIPTILVYENGELKNKHIGLLSKDELLKMLD